MAAPTSIGTTFWTLECGGVEKSFADWGLSLPKRALRSLHVSELTTTADGQDFDSDPLFAFGAGVKVRRDRVGSGTSYSGGSLWFQGYCSRARRSGRPGGEGVTYTISDLWWLFERTVFTQKWPGSASPISHVIMNMLPNSSGAIVSVPDQLYTTTLDGQPSSIGICNVVLSQFPGAFSVDRSLLPAYFPNFEEKRDITCAEAVRSQARWIPGMVSWVDHATSPPTIHFSCRFGTSLQVDQFPSVWPTSLPPVEVQMPSSSLTVGDGVTLVGGDVTSLEGRRVSQVLINYELTQDVDGVSTTAFKTDAWPVAGPDDSGGVVMMATIGLQIRSTRDQIAYLTSRSITDIYDPSWRWWTEKNPGLLNAQPGTLYITGISITDTSGGPATVYANELLNNGAIYPWMGGSESEVVVHGYAYYTDAITGEELGPEPLNHTIKTTTLGNGNGTPQTYLRSQITYGQLPTAPFGMASTLYSMLSVLQYEGAVQVRRADGEVSSQQFLGALLNLTGGRAEWETMLALVQEVEDDVEEGVTTVSFGVNQFMDPAQIIDLLRATRTRSFGEWTTTFGLGGGSPLSDVQMLDATAKQDSTRGNSLKNKRVTGGQNPDGTNTGFKIVEDATTGAISIYQLDSGGNPVLTSLVPGWMSGAGSPGPATLP